MGVHKSRRSMRGVSRRREDEYYIMYYYYYEEAILPSSGIALLYTHSRTECAKVRVHLYSYSKHGLVRALSATRREHGVCRQSYYCLYYERRRRRRRRRLLLLLLFICGIWPNCHCRRSVYIRRAIRLYGSRRLTISHLIRGAPPIHIPPLPAQVRELILYYFLSLRTARARAVLRYTTRPARCVIIIHARLI